MSPVQYDDFVAHSMQHFEEGLIRAGFVETDTAWRGAVPRSGGTTEILITLRDQFPFQPPKVVPLDHDAVPWCWHRELDGALCLVAEDDHEGLWWTEAAAFLEHITAWFEQADAGWPDDRLDMDLDRYFVCSEDTRLYLYDDLVQYRNRFVRFRPSSNKTMRIGLGTRPAKPSKHKNDRYGYVACLGNIAVPPRTWGDISSLIHPDVNLDRRIHKQEVAIIVLTYRRGSHEGAIALDVWPTQGGDIAVRRLASSADTDAAKGARAGLLAPALHECRVAIIGAGALGSFIADMLVRSGVRHLTLVDGDVVMPGNLVRHLVGPDGVGLSKVKAVSQSLTRRSQILASDIDTIDSALTTGAAALNLLQNHELVVNATADFTTTALLHVAAKSLGTNVLSAALQNDGATYRIDVLPPLDETATLPSSTIVRNGKSSVIFEVGCGSPVSPTPPHAVIEAAAATVRHAVGLLVGHPLHPAGETRNLQLPPEMSHQ